MILVVVLYATLALTFVIAKQALSYAQPFFLIGFRMIVAGIFLLSYLFLFNRKKFVLKKEDWALFLQTALFHIYLSFMLEFWALQKLTSAKTNIIYSATPFIAALLSYLLLSEGLTVKKWFGMAIGVLGLAPVVLWECEGGAIVEFFHVSTREAALFVAVTSGAYAWFLVKRLMNKGYSLLMINGASMLAGGIAAAISSLVPEVLVPYLAHEKIALVSDVKLFLFWVFLLILTANVIVYNLYGWLLKRHSITFVTFAGFLCPIFGGFFGWFFLNEPIGWHYFLSLGCVTVALYIFYQEELRLGS